MFVMKQVSGWQVEHPVEASQVAVLHHESIDVLLGKELLVAQLLENLLEHFNPVEKDREDSVAFVVGQNRLWVDVVDLGAPLNQILELL